jgi:hypothetical protein
MKPGLTVFGVLLPPSALPLVERYRIKVNGDGSFVRAGYLVGFEVYHSPNIGNRSQFTVGSNRSTIRRIFPQLQSSPNQRSPKTCSDGLDVKCSSFVCVFA